MFSQMIIILTAVTITMMPIMAVTLVPPLHKIMSIALSISYYGNYLIDNYRFYRINFPLCCIQLFWIAYFLKAKLRGFQKRIEMS